MSFASVSVFCRPISKAIHRLALPSAHLVWMHFVLGRDLLDGPVASQRFQRHTGLESHCKPASCRYLVFLRYPGEYTLTNCPIFWDHLTLLIRCDDDGIDLKFE